MLTTPLSLFTIYHGWRVQPRFWDAKQTATSRIFRIVLLRLSQTCCVYTTLIPTNLFNIFDNTSYIVWYKIVLRCFKSVLIFPSCCWRKLVRGNVLFVQNWAVTKMRLSCVYLQTREKFPSFFRLSSVSSYHSN